jgi:hypothetical protein
MREIRIPFVISPHEKALAEVYVDLNEKFNSANRRWRLVKKETILNSRSSVTGRLVIERLEGQTWEQERESVEYTVNETSEIENLAYCQALIKVLYFCMVSLGESVNWKFVYEDKKSIKKLYTPEISWEDDMKKWNIKIEELFKLRESLSDIKVYINRTTNNNYPLDALIRQAKSGFGSSRVTGIGLLRYIYGVKQYNAYAALYNMRDAKKLSKRAVTTLAMKEKEKQEIAESPAEVKKQSTKRSPSDVLALRSRFNKLGVGKVNYKEKLPDFHKQYKDISIFLSNATDEEISKALSLL